MLFCALLWGGAFPLIKFVYQAWGTYTFILCLFFAGVRFTLAGLGILIVCRDVRSKWQRADKKPLVILTLMQTCAQYACFYLGMSVSSGVLGSLLVGSGSFWWVLLAPSLLKTPRATGRDWLALTLCTLGIVLAVYAPGAGSGRVILGALCFLSASLFGALGLIAMRPLSRTLDAKTATGISLFAGGMLLMLIGSPAAATFVDKLTLPIAIATLALAAISGLAFSVWNRLAHEYSVNLLAGYRFLIPLSGAIQATLFVANERPGPGLIAGGWLIIAALVILQRPRRRVNP